MGVGFFRKVQSCCTFTLNASPVVLLSLIFIWAFWAYHFRLCLYLIQNDAILQGCLYIIFFEPIFFLAVWSFYKASRTSPGNTIEVAKKSEMLMDIEQGYQDSEYVQLLQSNSASNDHGKILISGSHQDHTSNQFGSSSGPATLNVDNDTTLQQQQQQHITTAGSSLMSSSSITVKRDGAKRYCQKCKMDKCDRSHHCRSCKRCILKMDHHCPWINNCVGFYNYKFFYLFIVYGALFCIYVFATTLPPTIDIMQQPMGILAIDFNWLFLCFVSAVFGLFLTPFSLFHTRQLCKNRTTIEFYEKANYRLGSRQQRIGGRRQIMDIMRSKYFNPWDLGTRENIEQVLGKSPMSWFLPVGTPSGNGCQYPLNTYAYDTLALDEDEDM
ncbi:DHHC palmitoyltransferase-domain-containing protein [Chlamydoabsidia padenii]|nr:DHHC palmitoyltransferase-domain-containing protein [Chlamydoabsidia padenii]